jgi:hypothetical protein
MQSEYLFGWHVSTKDSRSDDDRLWSKHVNEINILFAFLRCASDLLYDLSF